jgi:hypothetical protein
MLIERAAGVLVGPDVAIDRFVADPQQAEAAQPARHLVGTPIFAEQLLDLRPLHARELSIAARVGAPAAGVPVGELGAIGPVTVRAVALDLAPDRAAVAVQEPGDRGGRQPALTQQTQRVSFRKGDLAVQHR